MEFVEAMRLVYHLANGMELMMDEETPRELRRQAQCQSEALDLICEWLHAQHASRMGQSEYPDGGSSWACEAPPALRVLRGLRFHFLPGRTDRAAGDRGGICWYQRIGELAPAIQGKWNRKTRRTRKWIRARAGRISWERL
jgi:hypothetical protein